jgi:hypothetical protein
MCTRQETCAAFGLISICRTINWERIGPNLQCTLAGI